MWFTKKQQVYPVLFCQLRRQLFKIWCTSYIPHELVKVIVQRIQLKFVLLNPLNNDLYQLFYQKIKRLLKLINNTKISEKFTRYHKKIISCNFGANLSRKSANMQFFYFKYGRHFTRSRLSEVIQVSPDKVILAPSNVPATFCWNNQIEYRFGENAKMWIYQFKMDAISQGQGL